MTLAGLMFAATLLMQQPQAAAVPTGTAEFRGRVVAGGSGAPVAGASVILMGAGAVKRMVVTDENGRFAFALLPAGHYVVTVAGPGFTITAFGGDASRNVMIDLADGDRVDRGDLVLPTGGAISGQILDEHGNPLKGATVSAWRSRYLSPGEHRLSFEGQAQSDEAGDYRIAGLKPGVYFVGAKADEKMAPTFFPGTASAATAAPVAVTADNGVASISIRLLSMSLARVSGSILNSRGVPSADFYVLLAPRRDDGAQVSVKDLTSDVDAAGRFSVDKVPPGNYTVEVVAKARLEMIGATGRPADGIEGTESGSALVTVDGRDVDDLLIRTGPPSHISGKVTLDGAAIAVPLASRLTLRAVENAGPSGMRSALSMTFATPNADGTFTLPVIPGGRLIRVDGLPGETALKQILVNGVDVTDEGFDIGNAEIGGVIVALTSTPSKVTGRVSDSQGALVSNVSVIVFPAESRHWQLVQTRLIKSATTDRNGAFTVAALPAGSYYAVVMPTLTDGEWAEPANLERLRLTALSFKLSDGEQKTLALTLRK
jgi:hypothetical protein